MAQNEILTMKGITKTFPGVKALSNVDFKLCKGDIHALMGENGAGKSTLIKVLTGIDRRRTHRITGSVLYIRKSIFVRTLPWQRTCLSEENQESLV